MCNHLNTCRRTSQSLNHIGMAKTWCEVLHFIVKSSLMFLGCRNSSSLRVKSLMAQGDPFNVASITSPRDPCLLTLGRPVRPSGTGTIPSRCHCMKVEKVAKLHLWLHLKTPKLHAPSLTGVFLEHTIYSLCAPKLHWNSDEFQWHTAREAMRYQPCNHVNVLSVHMCKWG